MATQPVTGLGPGSASQSLHPGCPPNRSPQPDLLWQILQKHLLTTLGPFLPGEWGSWMGSSQVCCTATCWASCLHSVLPTCMATSAETHRQSRGGIQGGFSSGLEGFFFSSSTSEGQRNILGFSRFLSPSSVRSSS